MTMRTGIVRTPISRRGINASIEYRTGRSGEPRPVYYLFTCRGYGQVCGKKGFSLDFDQDLGRDQAADLDHAGRGTNVCKKLTMRSPYLLPLIDIGNIDSGPYDISQRRHRPCECRLYVL